MAIDPYQRESTRPVIRHLTALPTLREETVFTSRIRARTVIRRLAIATTLLAIALLAASFGENFQRALQILVLVTVLGMLFIAITALAIDFMKDDR